MIDRDPVCPSHESTLAEERKWNRPDDERFGPDHLTGNS